MERRLTYLTKFDLGLLGLSMAGAVISFALMQAVLEGQALTQGAVVGHIRKFNNDVRTRSGSSLAWLPVDVNGALRQGQSIFTGDDSSAQIELANHSVIEVAPKTLLVLDTDGDQVNVEIKTGSAQLTLIKGADVVVKREGRKELVKAEGTVSTAVIENAVAELPQDLPAPSDPVVEREVASVPGDRTLEIAASETALAPAPFMGPVLSSVQLTPNDSLTDRRPVTLTWQDSGELGAYEIQLSADETFKKSESFFASGTTLVVQLPPDSVHYARVRAVKSFDVPSSHFSAPAKVALRAEVQVAPPQPIAPGEGAEVTLFKGQPQAVLLRWAAVNRADRYEIQILDSSGEHRLHSAETSRENLVWMAEGDKTDVLWQVRARVGRTLSSWSEPRPLKLKFH